MKDPPGWYFRHMAFEEYALRTPYGRFAIPLQPLSILMRLVYSKAMGILVSTSVNWTLWIPSRPHEVGRSIKVACA